MIRSSKIVVELDATPI